MISLMRENNCVLATKQNLQLVSVMILFEGEDEQSSIPTIIFFYANILLDFDLELLGFTCKPKK
jgi:hypothetical protein